YIPTVKVLKKVFKGKNHFEFEPLLFNYGFFKVDYDDACNPDFLMELRSRISAIYGWVKDPATSMVSQVNLKRGNTNFYNGIPAAAVAKDSEIADLISKSDS